MRRRRLPSHIASALGRVTGAVAPATTLAVVQRVWESAVGQATASASRPVSERDGVVTVVCDSASWSEQLTLMQTEIMDRLASELPDGAQAPRQLRFVVGSRQA